MAYIRSAGDEKILVVLNPTEKDQELPDTEAKELIYVLGSKPENKGNTFVVKAKSAVYAKL